MTERTRTAGLCLIRKRWRKVGTFVYRAEPPVKKHTCKPPYNVWDNLGDGKEAPTPGSLWLCQIDHVLWKFDPREITSWVEVRGRKKQREIQWWLIDQILPGPFKPLKVKDV